MLSNCDAGEDCWESLDTARRSNQSILKKISPKYSLEGLMLKLKLQYFGYLRWRTDSLEKTLMLGKLKSRGEGDDRGWDALMASTQWMWVWASSVRWWWTGSLGMLQSIGSQRVRHDWMTELNWTELDTSRRSNQAMLKEINPEYSLEGLMLKLKLQYLGCLMERANSLEKTLFLGKTEAKGTGDGRGWDG